MSSDIDVYHEGLAESDRTLCEHLRAIIEQQLPEAQGKVWHGHPVWFIDENPIVGYHRLKPGVRVLFWSGQSFATPGLTKSGSFRAAEFTPGSPDALTEMPFEQWLLESRDVQWDYKNLMKKKRLDKATTF